MSREMLGIDPGYPDARDVAPERLRELVEEQSRRQLGLYAKYHVIKADTREQVENCFVLRPGRDKAAREALRTYAHWTDNEALRADLLAWLEHIEASSPDPAAGTGG